MASAPLFAWTVGLEDGSPPSQQQQHLHFATEAVARREGEEREAKEEVEEPIGDTIAAATKEEHEQEQRSPPTVAIFSLAECSARGREMREGQLSQKGE